MRSYPYTVDNGHGEQLTFIGVTHGADGDRAEVEGVARPGAGPPMHVHYLQEEAARVVSGRLGYQVRGEDAQFAGRGERVVGKFDKYRDAPEAIARRYSRQGHSVIDPKDVMRRYTVEELCETAEQYYRSVSDPTPLMSKPFSFLHEAPEALQNLGLLLSGLHLGKTMKVLDFGAGTCGSRVS